MDQRNEIIREIMNILDDMRVLPGPPAADEFTRADYEKMMAELYPHICLPVSSVNRHLNRLVKLKILSKRRGLIDGHYCNIYRLVCPTKKRRRKRDE